jgi:SAM-dependent methyltransferase
VSGVDISQGMVRRATDLNTDKPNCRFLHNPAPDLAAIATASQDLVFSHIALQHIPDPDVILRYVRDFVRVARPDGVIVFQLLSRIPFKMRIQPRRRLYHLLRVMGFAPAMLYQRLGLTPMTVNCVPEAQVIRVIAEAGGEVLKVKPDLSAGPNIESRIYWARPAPKGVTTP